MGDTIWVDVQGRGKDDLPSDNSLMLRLEDQLARLSERLRVAKLSDYYDYSVLEEHYGGLIDDADADADVVDEEDGDAAGDIPPDDSQSKGAWFDPRPAHAAVRAIRAHLARHPDNLGFTPDASTAHWPDGLMEELEECERVLDRAVSSGRQFRFLIVP